MNSEILIAIAVVLVLLSLLVLIFVFTVKRVNSLMKKTFVDRLQEYDYLIDDKEKKIDILDKSIDRKTKSYAKLEQEVEELEKSLENVEEIKKEHIVLPTDADFEDGNILSGYKKIKDGFSFDVETKIKEFLISIEGNENHYDLYCNVKGYFTHSSIYTIMTYQSSEQKIIEITENLEKPIITYIESYETLDPSGFGIKEQDVLTCTKPVIYLTPTIQSANEVTYAWTKDGSDEVISTEKTLKVETSGLYTLVVTDPNLM